MRNIETSTINYNQLSNNFFFLELQSVIRNCTSPIYIAHIQVHSCLPDPMANGNGNEQADKLVSFATPKEQHALLNSKAGSLHQILKNSILTC